MTRKSIKAIQRIVQAGPECSPKSYRRAATQRLDVAKFLLENSEYYLDAVYLAGYAAECSLKALILKRTPKSKWADVCEDIGSGGLAHNFDYLEGILNLRQGSIPDEFRQSLAVIKCEWTTNLRYVGSVIPYGEAKTIIEHVELLYQWVERSS